MRQDSIPYEERRVGYKLTSIRNIARGLSPDIVKQIRDIFDQAKRDQALNFVNYSQHFTILGQILRNSGIKNGEEQMRIMINDLLRDLLLEIPQFACDGMDSRAIANILNALAFLSYRDECAIDLLLLNAQGEENTFDPQAIANTLFALAILEYTEHSTVEPLVQRAREMILKGSITDRRGIMQLKEFHMATGLLPEIDSLFAQIQSSLSFDRKNVSEIVRKIQRLVKQVILEAHPKYEVEENVTLMDIFEADILVTPEDNTCPKTDVEIDDHIHVLFELRDRFRDRILKTATGVDTIRLSTLPSIHNPNDDYAIQCIGNAVRSKLRTSGLL